MRVLFSDPVHLNEKNFPSLLEYLRQIDAKITKPENTNSIGLFGNYNNFKSITDIASSIDVSIGARDKINHRGINLFKIAQAELMSLCVTKEHWTCQEKYGNNVDDLFDRLVRYDKNDLALNLAAAKYWIDYWTKILESSTFEWVFVFSGSLIYSAALIEVMKNFTGRVFVFESFYSGRHYYCEEKYSHLANNSDSKYKHVLCSRTPDGIKIDQTRLERGIREALQINNKNVSQPKSSNVRLFNNGKPTVLIGGQVLNDFALLETTETGINSLALYRKIIHDILKNTSANIIFKAHPWENKKANLREPKTKRYIYNEFGDNSRIQIVENHALSDLLNESSHVIVISSQLAIEAALNGYKPYVLGDAFYGGHGFTHDLSVDRLDLIIDNINTDNKSLLSCDEYLSLRKYLMFMLIDFLVPEEKNQGVAQLKRIFGVQAKPKAPKQPVAPSTKVNAPEATIYKFNFSNKFKKFKRNPKKFFLDSKHKTFQIIGRAL